MVEENRLSREIIAAAIEVHRALGPGLLESAYEQCLMSLLSYGYTVLNSRRAAAMPPLRATVLVGGVVGADLNPPECL